MKYLSLAGFLVGSFMVCHAEELHVRNNCGHEIYVKSSGTNTGDSMLGSGHTKKLSMNRNSRGRVWAHVGCDRNGNGCDTTEGYVSLAEMFWDPDGKTWYDVSQVDGYNLPTKMDPYNPAVGGNCRTGSCTFNMNDCPGGDRVHNKGKIVGCRSPNRDDPNTHYVRAMKQACPGAYSWSKDDPAGMRDCHPGNNGLHITFC